MGWILAVIFLVLWLTKRSSKTSTHDQPGYNRGFWDGYTYLINKMKALAASDPLLPNEKIDLIRQADMQGSVGAIAPVEESFAESPMAESAPAATAAAVSEYVAPVAEMPAVDHSVRNLNALLYMASFLLTASAAAFIATSMPAVVKLVWLIIAVVVFYGAGLVIYTRVEKLRSAAIAFVGTGLAILPFVGIALHVLGGLESATAWLVISIVGCIAYGVAAAVLRSQVIAYLVMAFVLSLASSVVAYASVGFVWYFVAIILVATVTSAIRYFKPTWLPGLFAKPFDATADLVTPIALGASLLSFQAMNVHLYEIVFTVASLHYLITFLQYKTVLYETVVRFMLHITILIYAIGLGEQHQYAFGLIWLGLSATQAALSLLRLHAASQEGVVRESVWLIVMMGSMLMGIVFWQTYADFYLLSSANLVAVGLVSLLAALRLRSSLWAYPGFIISLLLPYILTQKLFDPALPLPLLASVYLVLAAAALTASGFVAKRHTSPQLLSFFTVSFWSYLVVGLFTAASYENTILIASTLLAASALMAVNSYVVKRPFVEVMASLALLGGLATFLTHTTMAYEWYGIALGTLSAALLAVVAFIHAHYNETVRYKMSTILALSFLSLVVFSGFFVNTPAAGTTYVLLAAAAFGSLATYLLQSAASAVKSVYEVFSVIYVVLLWFVGLALWHWWSVVGYAAMLVVFWLLSRAHRSVGFLICGNLALVGTVYSLLHITGFDSAWIQFVTVWISSAVILFTYFARLSQPNKAKLWTQLASVWALLGFAMLANSYAAVDHRYAAALSLLVIGGLMAFHARTFKISALQEAGIYVATWALQWMVGLLYPAIPFIFYAHWWAIELIAVAYFAARGRAARAIVGLGIISAISGFYALADGGGYSLLFLIEHLIYLVFGALRQKTWLIWWGMSASVLAIVYYLKDFLFLWLGFLGLFLIGIVVWRLTRINAKHQS